MGTYWAKRNGAIFMPEAIREEWLGNRGTEYIQIAVLGTTGFLAVPDGVEWALFEHYYPESRLMERALRQSSGVRNIKRPPPSQNNNRNVFKPYKVHRIGHYFSIPHKLVTNWGFELGGEVRLTDLQSGFFCAPSDTNPDLERLLPVNLLLDSSWENNEDYQHFRTPLAEAYANWTKVVARSVWDVVYGGGELQGLKSDIDHTLLCEKFGHFVVADVFHTAAEQEI